MRRLGHTPEFLGALACSLQGRDAWFEEFSKKYGDKGLAVLGVSLADDGWKAIQPVIVLNASTEILPRVQKAHADLPVLIRDLEWLKEIRLATRREQSEGTPTTTHPRPLEDNDLQGSSCQASTTPGLSGLLIYVAPQIMLCRGLRPNMQKDRGLSYTT